MFRILIASTLAILCSCSTGISPGSSTPAQIETSKRNATTTWRAMNDPALNKDLAAAFSENPSLRALALRISQTDAALDSANATTLPSLNLGFGYREGRGREMDFGPFDLGPWKSSSLLSWEIDISGKLRAAKNSAIENRNAAVWDYRAAQLILASRIAGIRSSLYRLNIEIKHLTTSIAANQIISNSLSERSTAGLIPDSSLDRQRGISENLLRQKLELQRLRDLAIIQLRTLRGGTHPAKTTQTEFPALGNITSKPLNQALATHPAILSAEANVRAAFQLEHSARLNLLPSLQLNALALGAQPNLNRRFMQWMASAGPSLDIPVYDAARLAAIKNRQAQAKIAAENYRETVLKTIEEIETAQINLNSRRSQLATATRETQSFEKSRNAAKEQFKAGLISEAKFLEAELDWLSAQRTKATTQQALLNAKINLLKATSS